MGSECGEVPTSPTKKRHHIDPDENIAEPKAVEEGKETMTRNSAEERRRSVATLLSPVANAH